MITINEITIVRDGREIIYDYSEQIPAGSITAIVGPNGSGKSTLLAAIAGDIAPVKGTITIDDLHPILTSPAQLAQIRAVAIQNQSYTLGFSVQQIIEMAGLAQDVMQALELTSLADRQVTTLSGEKHSEFQSLPPLRKTLRYCCLMSHWLPRILVVEKELFNCCRNWQKAA